MVKVQDANKESRGSEKQGSSPNKINLFNLKTKRRSEPNLTAFGDTNRLKQVRSSMHGRVNLKEYRHLLHPPSKLLLGNATDRTNMHRETMKVDRDKPYLRVQEEYRLVPKKHLAIINQKKFKAVHSQGPRSLQTDRVALADQKLNPRILKQAVLTIERYWQGYSCRKSFRAMLAIRKMMNEELVAKLLSKNRKPKFNIKGVSQLDLDELHKSNSPAIIRNSRKDTHSSNRFAPLNTDGSELGNFVLHNLQKTVEFVKCKSKVQKRVMLASRNNNHSMLEIGTVKLYPSDVNTVDLLNNSPLHYAAKNGNKGMCIFLLEKGAVVGPIGQEGNTPLHLAYLSGSAEVVSAQEDCCPVAR